MADPPITRQSISVAEYRRLIAEGSPAKVAHKKRNTEEEDLQRDCFEWIALHAARHPILRWALHVPNGGKRPRGEAGKLKRLGVKRGFPDVVVPRRHGRYAGFATELKSATGKISKEQAEWLEAFEADGWLVGVVRDLDAFVVLVRRYLDGATDTESGGIEDDSRGVTSTVAVAAKPK